MKIKDLVILMDAQNLIEEVAGPEKCWPGHRKVGTQPGTGKNKGKRVNKCKRIGENEYSYDADDACNPPVSDDTDGAGDADDAQLPRKHDPQRPTTIVIGAGAC